MPVLHLTKHHGLGNDFLVLVDPDGQVELTAALARALCDRHRGVGADGLIVVRTGREGTDVTMELRNADGGPAEMSGNGIRCLGQAVIGAGLAGGPELVVGTAGGVRRLRVGPTDAAGLAQVSVDMGPVQLGGEAGEWMQGDVKAAARASIGNPHVVLLVADVEPVDVTGTGPDIERAEPGGANVEWIAPAGEDRLRLRVWERGAGATLACGTGTSAAVAVAHDWGLVGNHVVVDNPGGALTVDLHADGVVLTGPSQQVASVEVDLRWMGAL